MATQVFSAAEFERLPGFPEIDREELVRFFTLTPEDATFVRSHRGSAYRLGVAVQSCALPWLGFVPDDWLLRRPRRSSGWLSISGSRSMPSAATGTGSRPGPITWWRWPVCLGGARRGTSSSRSSISSWPPGLWGNDSPKLLFRLGCDYRRSARVIRPGPEWLSRRVAAAREMARTETFQRVEPLLDARKGLRAELDGLLAVDPELGSTRLHWLTACPTRATPAAVKAELAKLAFLRGLDAHELDLSGLPAERRDRRPIVARNDGPGPVAAGTGGALPDPADSAGPVRRWTARLSTRANQRRRRAGCPRCHSPTLTVRL